MIPRGCGLSSVVPQAGLFWVRLAGLGVGDRGWVQRLFGMLVRAVQEARHHSAVVARLGGVAGVAEPTEVAERERAHESALVSGRPRDGQGVAVVELEPGRQLGLRHEAAATLVHFAVGICPFLSVWLGQLAVLIADGGRDLSEFVGVSFGVVGVRPQSSQGGSWSSCCRRYCWRRASVMALWLPVAAQ